MTPDEENLLSMYGPYDQAPYSTYSNPKEDSFTNFINQREAARQKEAAAANANVQPPPDEMETDTPEDAALKKRLQSMYEESRNREIAGLGGLQKTYDEYGKNTKTDISPILGAIDTISGIKASGNYKRPETPDEIAYKKSVIGGMIQKAKGGITDTDLKGLAVALQGNKDSGRKERFETTRTDKAEEEITKDITKQIMDPSEKHAGFYRKAIAAFDSGDYGRIQQSLSSIARTVGDEKGALAEGDIRRQMLSTLEADIAKAVTYLSGDPQKIDPKVVESLRQNIEESMDVMRDQTKGQLENRVGNWSATSKYGRLFKQGGSGTKIHENTNNRLDKIFSREKKSPIAADTTASDSGIMDFNQFTSKKKK